jgi:hypothetical protein
LANPTFVQAAHYDGTATAQSVISTTINGVASGDSLVVTFVGSLAFYAGYPISCTDSVGNIYKLVQWSRNSAGLLTGTSPATNFDLFVEYAALNVTGGNLTVTLNLSQAISYPEMQVLEYSNTVLVSGSELKFSTGTSAPSGSLTTFGPNQTLISTFAYSGATNWGITNPGSYTQRLSVLGSTTQMVQSDFLATIGGQYSSTYGNASGYCTITALADGPVFTNGLVVLGTNGGAGSIINSTSSGSGNTTTVQVFDANTWSVWQNPNLIASQGGIPVADYVGIDCGAATVCDHVLFSVSNPQAWPFMAGSQFEGTNDPTWSTFTVIHTLAYSDPYLPPSSIQYGTLLNSISFGYVGAYRYYRLTIPNTNAAPADLEFYGSYYSGVNATVAPVTFSPAGGRYALPTLVTLTTPTTGATISYTTDGTDPTTSGTAIVYTKPILISSNTVIQASASLTGLSKARVTLASFHIASLVPTDIPYEVGRNGYRMWSIESSIFFDPVSGLWYWYGMDVDQPGVFVGYGQGISVYSSPDLRNWTWVGNCSGIVGSTPPLN